jgi:hypothetical protein
MCDDDVCLLLLKGADGSFIDTPDQYQQAESIDEER